MRQLVKGVRFGTREKKAERCGCALLETQGAQVGSVTLIPQRPLRASIINLDKNMVRDELLSKF